jgi:hypothetical protein
VHVVCFIIKNVHISLHLNQHQAMKAYVIVDIWFYAFVTSIVDGN